MAWNLHAEPSHITACCLPILAVIPLCCSVLNDMYLLGKWDWDRLGAHWQMLFGRAEHL